VKDILVLADAGAVSGAAADLFQRASRDAVAARGVFSVALAGGSTPRGLYSLLATDPSRRETIPWDRVEFFWGDERHVPPDHRVSNYRMAQEAMLSLVPVKAERVHRVQGEQPDAAVAASLYEAELRRTFGAEREIPRLDLVLLGLGPDGHTASLFPGTHALSDRRRLYAANRVDSLATDRITATFPLLNAARQVVFVVAGAEKAPAVRRILEPDADTPILPARLDRPERGTLHWLVDRAAAGRLTGDGAPAGGE
jgi:6-phosphogluconolactonase